MSTTRRRLLDDTFKKSVVGNPAIATDSLARMYPGIEMQGWTEQDGTPTPEAPVPIVNSGTQNQETGKWEYEITITNAQTDPDKNQTVTLTSDRPLTKWDKLEKRNGQWGWAYKSRSYTVTGEENFNVGSSTYVGEYTSNVYFVAGDVIGAQNVDNEYCNRLSHVNSVWTEDGEVGWCVNADQIHTRLPNEVLGTTQNTTFGELVIAFKNYYTQQYEEGNPFIFWYETTEETFVPLTTAEQEAMNALYTYRPTTVLSNQQGCQMTLTYKTREGVEGGDKLLKPNGAISAFNFNVKWNETNKIILRESGINDFANNMFFTGINRQFPYISIGSGGSFNVKNIEEFSCNLNARDIADGNYHEIIFTFKKPNSDIEITNIWDKDWSKEIVYHNIQFWDGDTLVRDYIPYSKNADYMYDRIGKTFVQATIPGVYQLI